MDRFFSLSYEKMFISRLVTFGMPEHLSIGILSNLLSKQKERKTALSEYSFHWRGKILPSPAQNEVSWI